MRGKLDSQLRDATIARITPSASLDDLAGVDMVVEAVVEDLAVKQTLFAALDEIWYLDPPEDVRRARLIDRHIAFGRSPAQARDFALGSDERNAQLIRAGRSLADLVLTDTEPANA